MAAENGSAGPAAWVRGSPTRARARTLSACTGESIEGELRFHFLITATRTPSGVDVFNGHVWTHTEATGVTTGAKYVGNLVSTSMIIQTIDGGLFVTTNPANIHLTQQGEGLPGDDLFLHALLHVVLLDGQAPVVNIDFRTECR